MNAIAAGTLAIAALLTVAPLTAIAQHPGQERWGWHGDVRHFDRYDNYRWREGLWRHGWHDGRNDWRWIYFNLAPYRPPLFIEQAPVVVLVPAPMPIQTQPYEPPVAALPVQQFWYYCDAAKAYYPYVSSCPSGWKTVPATPSGTPQ